MGRPSIGRARKPKRAAPRLSCSGPGLLERDRPRRRSRQPPAPFLSWGVVVTGVRSVNPLAVVPNRWVVMERWAWGPGERVEHGGTASSTPDSTASQFKNVRLEQFRAIPSGSECRMSAGCPAPRSGVRPAVDFQHLWQEFPPWAVHLELPPPWAEPSPLGRSPRPQGWENPSLRSR